MVETRHRIVFVHGSVMGGRPTWSRQRVLAERFSIEILDRPGFPPNPPVERIDFAQDAVLVAEVLRDGAHLVGHSYGGVIALLAAALAPESVYSLTVIEPPATRPARGNPAVDAFAQGGIDWWASGPKDDPEAFLRGFLGFVGSGYVPPSPLPPEVEQGARMLLVERGPWEAEIPLDELARAPFPKLVVSGGHLEPFDAICDALADGLGAERLVLPGYGHTAQMHPEFNEALAEFVGRANSRAGEGGTGPAPTQPPNRTS